jgi:murein tripeptide amidase MpaA
LIIQDLISITKKLTVPDELLRRKVIIITARVHPGETNSSWVVQGLINFFLSDTNEALYLRSNYIIKIIPMINPGIFYLMQMGL